MDKYTDLELNPATGAWRYSKGLAMSCTCGQGLDDKQGTGDWGGQVTETKELLRLTLVVSSGNTEAGGWTIYF